MIVSFISVDTEIKEQNEGKCKLWFVTMPGAWHLD